MVFTLEIGGNQIQLETREGIDISIPLSFQKKQLKFFGPKGGRTDKERAVVKYKSLPPMFKKGQRFAIVYLAKHSP